MYRLFGKRFLDIIFSLAGLIICLPVFILAAILIKLESPGPVFFIQKRMGKNGILFNLFKLRTMLIDTGNVALFEPGSKIRVTRVGSFLRRSKIDELPQLLNILVGNMSFVGPRPEVTKYKKFYTGKNSLILSIRPGITDKASIKYRKEEELLAKDRDPEKLYTEVILPDKLNINIDYVRNGISLLDDLKIIVKTVLNLQNNKINDSLILHYRKTLIMLAHFAVIVFSIIASFLLRFEFSIPAEELKSLYFGLFYSIIIKSVIFKFFGLYRGLWAYASIGELWKIIKANIIASIVFIAAVVIFAGHGFPRSIFIIDFLLCTGLVASLRFVSRALKEKYYRKYGLSSKKILVVGAGETGVMLLREFRKNPKMGQVVGFIDDDRIKLNESILGVRIIGNRKAIPKIVDKYEIEEIVITMPSVKGEQMRDILSYCEKTKAKIKVLPQLDKILSGKMVIKPREVQPEDLLGRETVSIDLHDVNVYIKDKVVLITGAGGSIGSEIARQVAYFSPKELILFDHHENFLYFLSIEFRVKFPKIKTKIVIGDVGDVGLLRELFSKNKPQVVFHAAAHKHVPLMEDNPVAAVKNNIFGSRALIYSSNHYNVEKFILISTDKAVNPTSIMGMSKRIAEIVLQSRAKNSKTKFMAVRFGNVLGSSGSVVPLFKKQIAEGGPLTITHPDVERYFMSVKEAVMLVLQAGALGNGGELFILDMGEQIKIIDIARNLISLSGLTLGKDIEIKTIGLRPGEKLSEEILLDKEKDKVTKHEKIYISQPESFDSIALRKNLKELKNLADMMDGVGVIKKMKEIIE